MNVQEVQVNEVRYSEQPGGGTVVVLAAITYGDLLWQRDKLLEQTSALTDLLQSTRCDLSRETHDRRAALAQGNDLQRQLNEMRSEKQRADGNASQARNDLAELAEEYDALHAETRRLERVLDIERNKRDKQETKS